MNTQISHFAAKSPEASKLRKRKYELVRRHDLPEDLLGGSLSQTHRRCGKANCRCAAGRGHPLWSVTFSHRGQRRVERIPHAWVEQIEAVVLETQAYLDAIKEVMAINIELLAQTRAQQRRSKRMPQPGESGKSSRKSRAKRSSSTLLNGSIERLPDYNKLC
jgi:hypothetical protein